MIDIRNAVLELSGFPEGEAEDIRRCLMALYSVRTGEQPLDREFGISNDFLDYPDNIARNMAAVEVIEKTQRYERRVDVAKVEYKFTREGQMVPVIYLKKGGGR